MLGRVTASDGLIRSLTPKQPVVTYRGGALDRNDVEYAIGGIFDEAQRHATIEQLVRVRLLAVAAESAGLHRTPTFLRSYSEADRSPHPHGHGMGLVVDLSRG